MSHFVFVLFIVAHQDQHSALISTILWESASRVRIKSFSLICPSFCWFPFCICPSAVNDSDLLQSLHTRLIQYLPLQFIMYYNSVFVPIHGRRTPCIHSTYRGQSADSAHICLKQKTNSTHPLAWLNSEKPNEWTNVCSGMERTIGIISLFILLQCVFFLVEFAMHLGSWYVVVYSQSEWTKHANN